MTQNKIKSIATSLHTKCPFSAASAQGITVVFSELPDSTKGVCYTVLNKKIILINSALSKRESEYVCAHELGHALLHPELNYSFLISETLFVPQKYEREADIFAAELLIDDRDISSVEFEQMSLKQISSALNLPEKLISLKIGEK